MKVNHSRALWLLALPFLMLGGCALAVDRTSDAYAYPRGRWDNYYSRGYYAPTYYYAPVDRDHHDRDHDHDRIIIHDDHGYAHERW